MPRSSASAGSSRLRSLRLKSLRFGVSDRFELVLHDRLRPEEARRFEPLRADPNHWGVLRPRGAGNYRAIDRDTALLLFTLGEPGPLPEYLFEDDPSGVDASIRAMVLDGILDAETEDGEPVRLIDGLDGEALDIDSRSLAALRYGAALDARDARDLSIRLYLYGGEPLRRSVCDRLATRPAVLEFLGLERGGSIRRGLPAGWSVDDRPEKDWIFFRRSAASGQGPVGSEAGAAGSRGQCKLYVGSRLLDVPLVLETVVAALAASAVRSMKVGSSAIDLARADKIVVYFDSFEALLGYASVLSERLRELDLTATGAKVAVPFTAPAGADGMLSWGVDPPKEAIPLERTFSESWRAWVASRLATALVSTRDQGLDGDERLRAVLDRVRLDGVDTSRWTPGSALWSEP